MIRNGFIKMYCGSWINLKDIHIFVVNEREEDGSIVFSIFAAVKSPLSKKGTLWPLDDQSFATGEEALEALDLIIMEGGRNE